MNREDIIRMALEAGFGAESEQFFFPKPQNVFTGVDAEIQRFAALVAAAEREACAQICDEHSDDPVYCGQAIRARGQE
jgi:hypothetical protein